MEPKKLPPAASLILMAWRTEWQYNAQGNPYQPKQPTTIKEALDIIRANAPWFFEPPLIFFAAGGADLKTLTKAERKRLERGYRESNRQIVHDPDEMYFSI